MKWKKTLLQLHLYLGLFCAPYLLIFGVSSLSFNHVSLEEEFTPISTEQLAIAVEQGDFENARALDDYLADSLHLMGWFIPWESRMDSTGFLIDHRHLGKDYRLEGSWSQPPIQLTTHSTRTVSMLKGLHGLHEEIPRAPWWINLWGYYQDITVYSLLFWAASGVYLWWVSKSRSRSSAFWLAGGAAFSILLMTWLWLAG